jgi:hypothetical protein
MQIEAKIEGWRTVLFDKCNNNKLTHVTTVNQPDLSTNNIENTDLFVFANILPPGYH